MEILAASELPIEERILLIIWTTIYRDLFLEGTFVPTILDVCFRIHLVKTRRKMTKSLN